MLWYQLSYRYFFCSNFISLCDTLALTRFNFSSLICLCLPTTTTRKSINTNKNTERIFPSVNFQGILLTEIFSRYIPRELQWEKKLKQNKKNNDVSFLPTKFIPSVNSSVNCEHCSLCQLQRESPMEFSVGIFQFRRYFSESSRTIHFLIALLIVVLYGQNHWQIEKSSVLFGGFLKKFN